MISSDVFSLLFSFVFCMTERIPRFWDSLQVYGSGLGLKIMEKKSAVMSGGLKHFCCENFQTDRCPSWSLNHDVDNSSLWSIFFSFALFQTLAGSRVHVFLYRKFSSKRKSL